jgi:hypothetical protein
MQRVEDHCQRANAIVRMRVRDHPPFSLMEVLCELISFMLKRDPASPSEVSFLRSAQVAVEDLYIFRARFAEFAVSPARIISDVLAGSPNGLLAPHIPSPPKRPVTP